MTDLISGQVYRVKFSGPRPTALDSPATTRQRQGCSSPCASSSASSSSSSRGGTVGDHHALVDDDRARQRLGHHGQVVGADQQRLGPRGHHAHELAAAARVEPGRGLVEHQHRWGPSTAPWPPRCACAGRARGGAARVARSRSCPPRPAPARRDGGSRASGTPMWMGPKATSSPHGGAEELVVGILEDEADRGADLLGRGRLRRSCRRC